MVASYVRVQGPIEGPNGRHSKHSVFIMDFYRTYFSLSRGPVARGDNVVKSVLQDINNSMASEVYMPIALNLG